MLPVTVTDWPLALGARSPQSGSPVVHGSWVTWVVGEEVVQCVWACYKNKVLLVLAIGSGAVAKWILASRAATRARTSLPLSRLAPSASLSLAPALLPASSAFQLGSAPTCSARACSRSPWGCPSRPPRIPAPHHHAPHAPRTTPVARSPAVSCCCCPVYCMGCCGCGAWRDI
jgi:hypothetical protein